MFNSASPTFDCYNFALGQSSILEAELRHLRKALYVASSTLHVVFNASAGGGLRDALRQAGRNDRVVNLFDSLSFGPINPPDPELRQRWVEKELGYTNWEEVVGEATSFWIEACSARDRRVAWLSRRTTQEYAGFLEWLWRVGEEPIEVVDLTDVVVMADNKGPTKPRAAISLAMLNPQQIIDNDLFARAEILTPALRTQYHKLWERLRAENAAMRVLTEDGFVSTPISFFDPLLLSHLTQEWQKAAMVIGNALTDFWDTNLLQTGDLVLAARLRALASAGVVESQGNLFKIRHSEVRLPTARH